MHRESPFSSEICSNEEIDIVNRDFAKLYNDDMFRIIGRARSSFQLAVLELI